MEPDPLIQQIHDARTQFVLAVTGGGSEAVARLLTTPGASRTVLEAIVPYSPPALADWLGASPEQYCSPATARAMAMAAFQRALKLASRCATASTQVAGIGCTASLASDRAKRGEHRAHVAAQTATATQTWSITFVRGRRSRAEEEREVARVALHAVAIASGVVPAPLDFPPDEPLTTARTVAPAGCTELLLQQSGRVLLKGETETTPTPLVIFSGAFNPRHEGHRQMASIATELTGHKTHHEISLVNVDKPALDFTDLATRTAQFDPTEPLWLTHAPTFIEKSDQFPGAMFVVGADTIRRIADAKYYNNATEKRDAAIAHLASRGCRFLVFGRALGEGFASLGQMSLPSALAALCDEVPPERFRVDVSSTELRRATATE